ncbi:haloalkane dehalogenase family protein [Aspergillus costaricaensis CBS 115574]|uniref:Haloalkane dehalogenase family protein n=1 Tax=Aspergillus costaricaensis CBS 115574 TaxID=1448317 RepID=A0ACD1I140_9EURO|nr:haloalkane dehalogenase family protein [Aspergillus costaricaensis CBS 115574]RAK84173.1 haloalkane dehalogenase family protein [Aspergillus costaricaensis CBS 115574]
MSLLTLHVGSNLAQEVLTILMTSYGYAATIVMSFTVCRLILFGSLLPLYLGKLSCTIIPTVVRNFLSLFSSQGRNRLIREAEEYRGQCESLAIAQCQGTYRFSESNLYRVRPQGPGWMPDFPWADCMVEMAICGATVRFMHQKPTLDGPAGRRRPIIFLHGNPSWSYIWRNILPHLLDQGHEVYALDWLGHGRSDKPTHPESVTFELHIHTLMQLFKVYNLRHAVIVAHDWGGCVALCAIPQLPQMACTCLLLLNSFLPPRPEEWNLHYSLLYAIWFLSTGLLGGYMPEWGVMRFMSPHLSQFEIDGYSAPYRSLPVATKASVFRFGHIVPVTPRFALHGLRQTRIWKLLEGLCGPRHFDNLSQQARLAKRGEEVRQSWRACLGKGNPDVSVVFGEQDPLLKLYKDILVDCIHPAHMVEWAPQGIWLSGGGHYPMEEKAADISLLIEKLASQ